MVIGLSKFHLGPQARHSLWSRERAHVAVCSARNVPEFMLGHPMGISSVDLREAKMGLGVSDLANSTIHAWNLSNIYS